MSGWPPRNCIKCKESRPHFAKSSPSCSSPRCRTGQRPTHLTIRFITDAAVLLERFRFLPEEDSGRAFDDPATRERIDGEMADVLFFLLRLADRYNIDLIAASDRKTAKNVEPYPFDKVHGSNEKYFEL